MSHISLLDGHDDDTPLIVNKLVRDNIPHIIKSGGQDCEYEILSDSLYLKALDLKLYEEVREYQDSKDLEELADILEVIYSIARARGYGLDRLNEVAAEKVATRGSFRKRIFLTKIYP